MVFVVTVSVVTSSIVVVARGEGFLQGFHQINRARRRAFIFVSRMGDFLALGLGVDHGLEFLAEIIFEFFEVQFLGHGFDEFAGHAHFGGGKFDALQAVGDFFVDVIDFVGVVEGVDDEAAVFRADIRDVFALAHDEAGEGGFFAGGHGFDEEFVGFFGVFAGAEIVDIVVIDGVDGVGADELHDFEGARPFSGLRRLISRWSIRT